MIEVIAPGRICLFGDHQDYLKLPIIACAYNRYITLKAIPNNSDSLQVTLPDINKSRTLQIHHIDFNAVKGDHLLAALKVAIRNGAVPDQGYDVKIQGNIPINSGTSSSSALMVAWMGFLLKAYGCNKPITPHLIGSLAFEAEVLEQAGSGGKMDQLSIALGGIIYLETNDNANYLSFQHELPGLIIGESGVSKNTDGLLKELKSGALEAIETLKRVDNRFDLGTTKITDLPNLLKALPEVQKRFFKAAVTNYDITRKALLVFKNDDPDMQVIGDLMNKHHIVLKELLGITVPVIDNMIHAALAAGALGAKIVGSGGGGAVVAIARQGSEKEITEALLNGGAVKAYPVHVAPGVSMV